MVLTKGYWTDHVHELELTINKLKEKGPKYNIENSFFRKTEMEYLGFWVTHYGVKPIDKKYKQKIYEATDFSKISTLIYMCSELLPRYVGKAVAYVGAFN